MEGEKRVRVLLTNDDGYDAPGLHCVARALLRTPNVYDLRVCSPSEGRSGASHAITLTRNLTAQRAGLPDELSGVEAWHVDGTPVDCVKVALTGNIFGSWRPDLVISGCNYGLNAGICVLYSGTVGAALEGALHGIPSIACSLDFGQKYPLPRPHEMNWDAAEIMLAKIIGETVRNPLSSGFVLNVNLPHLPVGAIKGIRMCHQGKSGYKERMEEVPLNGKSGGDTRSFELRGYLEDRDSRDISYDTPAVLEGYVAITPLSLQYRAPDYEENWNAIHTWLRDVTFV